MIECKICNKIFEKIIPWQHLKTHDISSSEYKKLYGSLYSPETLAKHSQKIPHNKGIKVTDDTHLLKLKEGINKREQRFKNGEFSRGSNKTLEQKAILSEKTKEYAKNNPDEIKNRAMLAAITKKNNNVPGPMTGKKHSVDTIKKLSEIGKISSQNKVKLSHDKIINNIQLANLTLLNTLDSNVVELRCNKCTSEFTFTKQYFHDCKFHLQLCPTCFPIVINQSAGELELFEFIKGIDSTAIRNYRQSYHSKEIDIFLPNLNIGIEYNGLYWHSEIVLLSNNKPKDLDFQKQKSFHSNDIRLIIIYEDEWINKKDIVKDRIKNILNVTPNRIFARKCEIKIVDSKIASNFCNQYHIMGAGRSNVRVGLYYNNELVSLMTFSKNNISRKVYEWEINRFVSINDYTIVGGASKLFSYFIKHYNPSKVISYSDNRWSIGSLYQTLGFKKVSPGVPNYWYFLPNKLTRIHRYTLRKNTNDDVNLTGWENRQLQGYHRIWDCGSAKWVWTNEKAL